MPLLLVAFLSLREIGTADFWWQWATGRHILENGIPTHDPWLTTAEPQPWIELRWIYCVGLYWMVENVGAWLAILCVAALYVAGVGFAISAGGRAAPRWLMVAGVACAIAIGRRLVVRPEAFTLALLGLFLYLIARVRQKKLAPKWALTWLAAAQLLWVNTHALFALGPIMCAIWLACELIAKGEFRKVAATAFLITIACSFVNPYGTSGVLFPLTLLTELHVGAYRNNIVELRSPFVMGITPSLIAHMLLAFMVAICAWKKRGDSFLLIATATTFYLSLTAVRNVPLFAIVAVAYCSSCPLVVTKFSRYAAGVAGFVAVLVAYSFAIGTWTLEDRLGFGIDESRYGLSAARGLVEAGAPQPIFNTLVEGSLLEAERQRAYCDPRLEVLPQARFLEMLSIARLHQPFPAEFVSALVAIDSPIAAKLVKEGGWRLVGIDSVAIALVREEGASVTMIGHMIGFHIPMFQPDFSWFRISQSPVLYRRIATFFRNLGDHETADDLMEEARRVHPAR